MEALLPAALIALGVIPVGYLAARTQRSERLSKRLAAFVAGAVLLTLIVSLARCDLLRIAPGDAYEVGDVGAGMP